MDNEKRNSRIDVQVKLNKMIDMMQRPQGASISEICSELECTPKTFYRNLEKLALKDVPYFTKPDFYGNTSSVRYYIEKKSIAGSSVYLSSGEKALIRMMIESTDSLFTKFSEHPQYSQTLLNKLNEGIIHDTRSENYKYLNHDFTLEQKWEFEENFYNLANALELKQSITFRTSITSDLKYEKEFNKIEDKLLFQTYSIFNIKGIFYALGKVEPFALIHEKIPAEIRCIKISNIKDIKFFKQYIYSLPTDFDLKKWYDLYFPQKYSIQSYHIEVDKKTLYTVMHASQYYPEVIYDCGGKSHLVYRTQKKDEFLKYIRTLGSGAKVISPQSFANEIQEDLRKTLTLYELQEVPANYIEKNEFFLPEKSFLKYSWRNSNNSDQKDHWWRFDISDENIPGHEILNYSLFEFKQKSLSNHLECIQLENEKISDYITDLKKHNITFIPYLHIYEDCLVFELPFLESINADIEEIYKIIKLIKEKWSQKFVEEYLSKGNTKTLSYNSEVYVKNGPQLLLTGIKTINETLAYEIISKAEQQFSIPVKAIVLTENGKENGDMNITVYKYGKM